EGRAGLYNARLGTDRFPENVRDRVQRKGPALRLPPSRRQILGDAFCGFGTLALASLLREDRQRAAPADPLAAKPPHRPGAKAKAVFFLFRAGGPSPLEPSAPKPLLNKLDGKPRPAEFGEAKYQFIQKDARLLGSKRTFKKCGRSGVEVSDLFPH